MIRRFQNSKIFQKFFVSSILLLNKKLNSQILGLNYDMKIALNETEQLKNVISTIRSQAVLQKANSRRGEAQCIQRIENLHNDISTSIRKFIFHFRFWKFFLFLTFVIFFETKLKFHCFFQDGFIFWKMQLQIDGNSIRGLVQLLAIKRYFSCLNQKQMAFHKLKNICPAKLAI